jgi:hypothetical protein
LVTSLAVVGPEEVTDHGICHHFPVGNVFMAKRRFSRW